MPQEIDPRVVRVGIEIGNRLKTFEGLWISASGSKFASALQDECEVKIANLAKADSDYILTETSPYNRNRRRKRLFLWAGRQRAGVQLLFSGDITEASVTQPPDVILSMRAKTGQYFKGELTSFTQPASANLSRIAAETARSMDLSLVFEADDRKISNYSYTGSKIKQVDRLGEMGHVDAYVDGDSLVVKNANAPLASSTNVLSAETGMIGTPEVTEQGIRVRYMLDHTSRVGSRLVIDSKINPAANGESTIFKLGFEVSSRELPFYWIAETTRYRPGLYLDDPRIAK